MADNIFLTTDPEAVVAETLPDDISFGDFYERYLLDMEGRQKVTTLARRDAIVRDKILLEFIITNYLYVPITNQANKV